ncbi:hypothetical protein RintRC_4116 [Richelia intracellularis]|nr:hypothetical protein RintRC_4116 [Richelia intracellularis]
MPLFFDSSTLDLSFIDKFFLINHLITITVLYKCGMISLNFQRFFNGFKR